MTFGVKQLLTLLVCLFINSITWAAVLPEERADALYHSYDGGDVQVNGPSILVRKNTSTNSSVFYNFYIDHITSASLDVITTGSPYIEERTEQTLGMDYLHGKTTLNASVTNSTENDYNANTLSVSVSQDFFGDLSTLTLGYSLGKDDVSERINNNPLTFEDRADITRQSYRLGFSQVITKDLVMSLGFENITDEGTEVNGSGVTLNNPYRAYRYYDPVTDTGGQAPEKYPRTHTSNALAIRGSYYLSYQAALHGEYKFYQDSWGVIGHTFAVEYSHPLKDWVFDFRYRLYSQTKADFYSDLFNRVDEFNFMARDKELSTFTSNSIGVSASYEFAKTGWGWIDKGSLNMSLDHIEFSYDDFRDATASGVPGTEPFYQFGADVLQFFVSLWY